MRQIRTFSVAAAVVTVGSLCCSHVFAQPPSSADTVKQAEMVFSDTAEFVNKFASALAEVKDEKSAQTAVKKLEALKKEQAAIAERARHIKLDRKTWDKLTEKHDPIVEARFASVLEHKQRLENTPELKAAVGKLADEMFTAIVDCVPSRPGETIEPIEDAPSADWSLEVSPSAARKPKALVLPAHFKNDGFGCRAIALSADGKWLATANYIGAFAEAKHAEIRVWNARTGSLAYGLKGYPGEANQEISLDFMAFSPDGAQLVTSGDSGLLKFWDLKNQKVGPAVKVATVTSDRKIERATPVTCSGNGRFFAACRAGGIDMIDAGTGKKSSADLDEKRFPVAIVVSPDGKRIATFMENSGNTLMQVWDAEKRMPLWAVGEGRLLKTLRFADGGKTLLAFDHSSFEVTHYDSQTGEPKKTIKVQLRPDRKEPLDNFVSDGAAFVGDARLIVHEHLYGAALYDCATGAKLQTLEDEADVMEVASADDGTLVALSIVGGTRLIQLAKTPGPMASAEKKPKTSPRSDPPLKDDSSLRQWKSADGKFSVKAKFEKLSEKTVHLEREDGSKIQVPLEKLSKADQAWVRMRQ